MSNPRDPNLSDPPLEQNPPSPQAPVSAWLEVFEGAWRTLAVQHPDLPPVAFVVDSAPDAFSVRPCGHWTADRWSLPSGERLGELRLPAERLQQGPRAVLELLLHEAAHVLAHMRRVQETSRQGRYHNRRYWQLAHELGLKAEPNAKADLGQTRLPRRLRAHHADMLGVIEEALATFPLRSESSDPRLEPGAGQSPAPAGEPLHTSSDRGSSGRLLVVCGCLPPRKLRVSRTTLGQGPITCGLCGLPFDLQRATKGAKQASAPEPVEDMDPATQGRGA
jgi:hypothetical protein